VVHLADQQRLALLRLLAGGDVHMHAEHRAGAAAAAGHAPGAADHPARLLAAVAAAALDAELGLVFPALDAGGDGGAQAGAVIRVDEGHQGLERRHAADVGIGAEQRVLLGRPVLLLGVGVPFPGADARDLLRQAQAALMGAQRLLGGAEGGGLGAGLDDAGAVHARDVAQHPARGDADLAVVLAPVAQLALPFAALLQVRHGGAAAALREAGAQQVVDAAADRLLRSVAEQPLRPAGPVADDPVGRADHDARDIERGGGKVGGGGRGKGCGGPAAADEPGGGGGEQHESSGGGGGGGRRARDGGEPALAECHARQRGQQPGRGEARKDQPARAHRRRRSRVQHRRACSPSAHPGSAIRHPQCG
jgi:hypothetical protein